MNDNLVWSFEVKGPAEGSFGFSNAHFAASLDWNLKSLGVAAFLHFEDGTMFLDFGIGPLHFGAAYKFKP